MIRRWAWILLDGYDDDDSTMNERLVDLVDLVDLVRTERLRLDVVHISRRLYLLWPTFSGYARIQYV